MAEPLAATHCSHPSSPPCLLSHHVLIPEGLLSDSEMLQNVSGLRHRWYTFSLISYSQNPLPISVK